LGAVALYAVCPAFMKSTPGHHGDPCKLLKKN
jgi:hypothetical protein